MVAIAHAVRTESSSISLSSQGKQTAEYIVKKYKDTISGLERFDVPEYVYTL